MKLSESAIYNTNNQPRHLERVCGFYYAKLTLEPENRDQKMEWWTIVLIVIFIIIIILGFVWALSRQKRRAESLVSTPNNPQSDAQPPTADSDNTSGISGDSISDINETVTQTAVRIIDQPANIGKPLVNETECRRVLESIYNKSFPNKRYDFLKTPDTEKALELDCYNDELKIAVEYNGKQHYVFPNYYDDTYAKFERRVILDKYKKKRCDELGIYLITVPYTVRTYDIEKYIRERLPNGV